MLNFQAHYSAIDYNWKRNFPSAPNETRKKLAQFRALIQTNIVIDIVTLPSFSFFIHFNFLDVGWIHLSSLRKLLVVTENLHPRLHKNKRMISTKKEICLHCWEGRGEFKGGRDWGKWQAEYFLSASICRHYCNKCVKVNFAEGWGKRKLRKNNSGRKINSLFSPLYGEWIMHLLWAVLNAHCLLMTLPLCSHEHRGKKFFCSVSWNRKIFIIMHKEKNYISDFLWCSKQIKANSVSVPISTS